MRFFILSDFHLGLAGNKDNALGKVNLLCNKIHREITPAEEPIIFLLMGDMIDKGDTKAFSIAREVLDHIQDMLENYQISFEMVPGNHDRHDGDIRSFDQFAAQYGIGCTFETGTTYSKEYDGINFIFTDSTFGVKHNEPGNLDMSSIRNHVQEGKENLLFCHHALTQKHTGDHDCILNADQVAEELKHLGIHFLFHGHTHQADVNVSSDHFYEIGTGSLLKSMDGMPEGIYNQFITVYSRAGRIVGVERLIYASDLDDLFPSSQLFPKIQQFSYPDERHKRKYPPVAKPHIPRKGLLHDDMSDNYLFSFSGGTPLTDILNSEKHVLLLSDAGCGKSVELQNLAYEIGETFRFPVLFHLKYYQGQALSSLLPAEYQNYNPGYITLLLDGYDEIPGKYRIDFKQALGNYISDAPAAQILISSRSNFCKGEYSNQSRSFPGFVVCDLCPLSREDQLNYLNARKISPTPFYDAVERSNATDLLDNPFYLVAMADIYTTHGALNDRTVIMDQLIRMRFRKDDEKFLGGTEDTEYQAFCLLEKLAFSMQLMRKQFLISESEYQRLFCGEERGLLQKSGLLEREENQWQFTHNNFREYLTAKYLLRYPFSEYITFLNNVS